jgi:hypothetical protein
MELIPAAGPDLAGVLGSSSVAPRTSRPGKAVPDQTGAAASSVVSVRAPTPQRADAAMYPPDGTATGTPASGEAPPAVVSLLAGQLDSTGYPATLLDLAARGWFRLAEPEPGRVMCLLPPDPPRQALAPYEERAAVHLARRAAGRGEVPAAALAEGFADGQVAFGAAFHDEVVADARRRGLIRPRLRGGTALLLGAAALIPAALVAGAVDVTAHPGRAFLPVLCWLVLLWVIGLGLRGSERPTPAGQACVAQRRRQAAVTGAEPAATLPGGDASAGPGLATVRHAGEAGRAVAYAAALGAAPDAVAVFTRTPTAVWSSYGGRWRQLSIGEPAERSWPENPVPVILAALGVPAFSALVVFGTMVVPGAAGMVLVAGATAIGVTGAVMFARSRISPEQLPRSAGFDGVVLERWTWVQRGGEGGDVTCYGVALDDGQRDQAWSFTVDRGQFARLVPGTLVHATVNPRRNKLIAATVTGRPQLPPEAAAARTAKPPLRARVINAEEAGRVLGMTEQDLECYLLGVSCLWKRAKGKGRGSITITAGRRAMLARHAQRTGRPLPEHDGVEGWLVGDRSVLLRHGTMVVKIVLTGSLGMDRPAALAWLAERATERLAAAPGDDALSEDEWAPVPER